MVTPRFVVVVGTDTGVGKTVVTAGLARALVHRGREVVAVKPVESGCASAEPVAEEDGVILAAATGQRDPREALVRLRAPLTPALAAEREGVPIDLDGLTTRIRALAEGADLVLVEGAGGVLSPLSWTEDITHLAHRLDARVLLVGSDRLGTLSHVHAAAQVLLDTWLVPVGVVLSTPPTPDESTGSNASALRRRLAQFGELHRRIVTLARVANVDEAALGLLPVLEWLEAP